MKNKSLAYVAPVAAWPQVVYKHQEEQHEDYAGKSVNGTDQEHHDQTAKDAKSAGMPRKKAE